VVRALVNALLLRLVVRVRVRVGQPPRRLPVPSVHEPALAVRLVRALAASGGGLLAVVAVGFRLRHPDVFGAAGTHVPRVVLQLPDQVLQVADPDGTARRHLVLVLLLGLDHHLKPRPCLTSSSPSTTGPYSPAARTPSPGCRSVCTPSSSRRTAADSSAAVPR
jgi:hypothetical protein